jgi:[ribosomal protein S5]-alanine N-acetyltransferase
MTETVALADVRVQTRRLTVRPVEHADLEGLQAVNGDPEVTRFLPYETWTTPEHGRDWLTRMQALAQAGNAVQLVLQTRTHTQTQVIGSALLFKLDSQSRRVELGYVLGRAHWRQGYMREALQGLCAHAFEVLKLRRIEAEVNPANQPSCALLQQLGFVHEGTARQRWCAKGRVYDTRLYGLLASEWPAHAA